MCDLSKRIRLRKDNNNGVILRIPVEIVHLLNLSAGQFGQISATKRNGRIVLDFNINEESAKSLH